MERFGEETVYYDTLNNTFIEGKDRVENNITHSRYIPVPTFDNDRLIESYVHQLSDKLYKRDLLNLEKGKNYRNKFHILINDMGLYDDFVHFTKNEEKKLAEAWCTENNIEFTLKRVKE